MRLSPVPFPFFRSSSSLKTLRPSPRFPRLAPPFLTPSRSPPSSPSQPASSTSVPSTVSVSPRSRRTPTPPPRLRSTSSPASSRPSLVLAESRATLWRVGRSSRRVRWLSLLPSFSPLLFGFPLHFRSSSRSHNDSLNPSSAVMAATLAAGRDHIVGNVPLRRIGEPDDVAGACIFLSSKAGSFVNGATIALDGGTLVAGKL